MNLDLGKACFEATTRKQEREDGGVVEGWPSWDQVDPETQLTYQKAALVDGSPLLEEMQDEAERSGDALILARIVCPGCKCEWNFDKEKLKDWFEHDPERKCMQCGTVLKGERVELYRV